MGCDIHIGIQVQDESGSWRHVPWQRELYEHEREAGVKPAEGIPIAPEVFDNRNYDLFGILADVRNGVGFAGVKTGDSWPSIAPDRGLPEDADVKHVPDDPRYAEDGEPRYLGDHSFTWVSLDELKAFGWDSVARQQLGVVKADEYEKLSSVGDSPESYCSGITGPGVQVYSPESYQEARSSAALAEAPYVRMAWDESARSATCDWPGQVIPWLESLAAGRPLRLLMGFDS